MNRRGAPKRILLVTGMSGAGRSTALRTLEDSGWETVDNLPLPLLEDLLSAPPSPGAGSERRPLAVGMDSRTRGFNAQRILKKIGSLAEDKRYPSEILFLDCSDPVLQRRYSETRRRHPMAPDRPASDGIIAEREMLAPLQQAADHVIDTSDTDPPTFQQHIRDLFSAAEAGPHLQIMSFGFSRGLPRNADLVFDMRFLRNPHWQEALRPLTGMDAAVGDYIAGDDGYEDALRRIEELLLSLLPRYRREGKSYVSVAFGCTGGRHRSVHCAERVAARLRLMGFSPTLEHRDMGSRPRDDDEPGDFPGAGI